MDASSKGAVTQTGALTVVGTSSVIARDGTATKDITLANAGNDFAGAVTVDGAKGE